MHFQLQTLKHAMIDMLIYEQRCRTMIPIGFTVIIKGIIRCRLVNHSVKCLMNEQLHESMELIRTEVFSEYQ